MNNKEKLIKNQFNLNNWNENNINYFKNYLINLKNNKKIIWTQKIINTKMPVLAINSAILKDLANQIFKGNYKEFLNYNLSVYYEFTIINGLIINKLNNFNDIKFYLNNLANITDNWATCDTLSLKITDANIEDFFNLSKEYLKSNLTFKRRIGIRLWFKMLKSTEYTIKIIDTLSSLKKEEQYYVNMILAWFVCEMFIKHRTLALQIFEKKLLNKFTNNKAIQKCRDSFRVSQQDKELLLKYKQY